MRRSYVPAEVRRSRPEETRTTALAPELRREVAVEARRSYVAAEVRRSRPEESRTSQVPPSRRDEPRPDVLPERS